MKLIVYFNNSDAFVNIPADRIERNGERPMGDERNTFLVITNLFFSAMESEGE